ncbi:hypothetical protein FRUB_04807 [Fimbriiglobus ruber]|uniref:Uncharacterized protein n=1 Tax=Fimbriiglobus ruber TaxID=1908690 RepID=A0A225DX67_9BACT|nr:hypothetical protein FRUB_04807 [Fimbriiglobus ruber]
MDVLCPQFLFAQEQGPMTIRRIDFGLGESDPKLTKNLRGLECSDGIVPEVKIDTQVLGVHQ